MEDLRSDLTPNEIKNLFQSTHSLSNPILSYSISYGILLDKILSSPLLRLSAPKISSPIIYLTYYLIEDNIEP